MKTVAHIKTVTLPAGERVPAFGQGTWYIGEDRAKRAEEIATLDTQGSTLLREAADSMRLSARGYHRVLRVARTLADLDGAETIGRLHLAEALSYRALADDLRRAA